MTLAQLRYLLAIVEADLNITLAAERVRATQPGLSKQLKVLEEELGFQIFVRKGKSLDRLTATGAQVIERARVILAEAANIRTLAANHRGEDHGELVIATTQTQARYVLPPALKILKARYPNVTVRLNLFGDAERSLAARQDADLLIASYAERPQTDDRLLPLYRWRRRAVLTQGHELARFERPLALLDLAAHPLIGYESAMGSHAGVAEAFAQAGAATRFAYTAHDIEVIKTYVRSGLGVGLLAEMALPDDEGLLHRPIEGLPDCTAYAQVQKGRIVRDYVIDFLAALAPHVSRREIVRTLSVEGPVTAVEPVEWGVWRQSLQTLAAQAEPRSEPSLAA